MKTELEQIEKMSPLKLFKPKFMPTLLKAIEMEVTANVPNVETPDGRKAITSLAYKIARSKTTIDDLGKGFVAEQKSAIAAVDEVRRLARDFLDNLKAQVRKPLTEWEDTEQARIEKMTEKVEAIKILGYHLGDLGALLPSVTLEDCLKKLQALKITKIYQEFQDEAINAKNAAVVNLLEWIPKAKEAEREAADNRRRAEEEAENNRVEEEQRIAREAVEAADLESTRELQELQDKAAQETADQEKRERDTKHKGRVHREAAEAIKEWAGCDLIKAKGVVKAIVAGKIPNVTINY
jgi:hypothetical protein